MSSSYVAYYASQRVIIRVLVMLQDKQTLFDFYITQRGIRQNIINVQLNALPINELGEGTYETAWWCQAKCKP